MLRWRFDSVTRLHESSTVERWSPLSEGALAPEHAAFSVTVARFVVAEEDGFDSRTSDHKELFETT